MKVAIGVGLVLVAGVLAGCASPSARVAQLTFDGNETIAAAGNLRLVTVREHAYSRDKVLCAEPSPDYAIEFGNAAKTTVNADVTGLGNGKLDTDYSRTEKATPLEGRTAGVLALRDGLAAACQSYVNGVIGKDAYALILSQYGNLLVELISNSSEPSSSATATAQSADGKSTPAKATATASKGGQRAGSAASNTGFLTALLVSCIEANDPTRHRENEPTNRLLDADFCRQILRQAASRR